MPHLTIHYTGQLDHEADMPALCRTLADALLGLRDDAGQPVFPQGGTRVLAYPATHYAVSDGGVAGRATTGRDDYAFMYLNLRMGKGRSSETLQKSGDEVARVTHAFMAPVMAQRYLGITVQVDVGQEVYDNKHSNIHPLFQKP